MHLLHVSISRRGAGALPCYASYLRVFRTFPCPFFRSLLLIAMVAAMLQYLLASALPQKTRRKGVWAEEQNAGFLQFTYCKSELRMGICVTVELVQMQKLDKHDVSGERYLTRQDHLHKVRTASPGTQNDLK